MNGLVPLSGGLPDDVRELAGALRGLFGALGISVRRYATRRHRDAGSVSRFLNGTRIPSWEFVNDLINDVAELKGRPPTVETMEYIRGLHRTALEKSGAPQHRVQVLEDQLAEADLRSVRSSVLVKALEQALADAQHRVTGLEVQIRRLHGHQGRDDVRTDKVLQVYEDQVTSLRRERQNLLEQVDALADQLRDAHARRIEAEERCEELERELVAAERQWTDDGLHDAPGLQSLLHSDESAAPSDVVREASDLRSGGTASYAATKPLNQGYVFANFVTSECNRFARSAALAVAEGGAEYQLLYLHGPTAVGKTHLLHAVGHQAASSRRGARVEYVSAEEFTNGLVHAVKTGRLGEFRHRYRSADLLLVDDIQYLSGKDVTQEEFFHTFNALHNANKQIVISADRLPTQISDISERLRNRFEGGLTARIDPPDLPTRTAIVRERVYRDRLGFPPDVVDLIALRVERNVRELEGALTRVTAMAGLNKVPVDIGLAEIVLKDFVPEHRPVRGVESLRLIIAETSEYFGVATSELCGSSRSRVLVTARQIAMYLCRELTDMSPSEISANFGGREGDTVLNAERKVVSLMTERRSIYNQVTELTLRIKSAGEFGKV
ncbi:chromosomal replication initiator protein DnaA [Streptomyces sp. NPDC056529]|uniref:chromosomal replication initiator protein DnaA n=1 Tax=Streptomyces sp. NPDC056529 TaxID=3345855 RepID=UPI00368DEEB8